LLANRTERWRAVCLGLGSALHGRPEKFLDVSGRLHFEMTEILIAGQRATLDGLFQGATRPSRKHGQRVTHWNTRGLGPTAISACRIHVQSLHYSARN